ncbi:MAG: VOC family protein [SAR202 cluster bacterium]|nr:VOC family protein [SAR202 cluster bacterium]
MLKSIFHTGFVVQDMDKAIDFYTRVLGFKFDRFGELSGPPAEQLLGYKDCHIKVAFLKLDNGHYLELVKYFFPPSVRIDKGLKDIGAAHLGFYIEDMETFYREKSKLGLRFLNSPMERYIDGKLARRTVMAQDPDGNWLEFIEVLN